jgi:hypothetical protein
MIAAVKEEWKTATARLEVIETTTRTQAENHLHTIEGESVKQTQILTEGFADLRTAQAETNGYLKAVVEATRK